MQLEFLGNGGSGGGGCPTLLATDTNAYVVQGWETGDPNVVEIPHLLLGFAKPDTFVGAAMTDTGRGTFTLAGRPVTDPATLNQMDLAPGETAIEVPMCERKFYGAPTGR
ncbi:hypothetical protein ACFWPK_04210 [Nocardia sp. NPDC058519]|uniref:hypothetical protein n=1 Tax=Nocardia sp. NPDC058519 TaxID=3346535 RepID=UPI0036655E58